MTGQDESSKTTAVRPLVPDDFKAGDPVAYMPMHAYGRMDHPDVEHGVVTRINTLYVFVRFGSQPNSKACDPTDLVHTRPGR